MDVPEEYKEACEAARHEAVEAAVEHDDELMTKYLDGAELTIDEIRRAIRKATIAMEFVPVLCGASFKNKGVQALLDAVIDYLPSPIEVPAIQGHLPHHDETFEDRQVNDEAPFAALAFKIATDPFVGKLTFFRVYSGVLKSGSYVYNATKDKRERVGRLLQMHANKREEIEEVRAGDIAAAIGLKDTRTGDTMCDDEHPIILEAMKFPNPVIDVADRAEDEGGPGQAGDRAAEAVRRRSDLPRALGSGDVADDHLGHGRAAPRDHRRPHDARVQGRREHRPARRSPIARRSRSASRRSKGSSSGSRAVRASTATASSTCSRPSRVRASCSRTRSSAV